MARFQLETPTFADFNHACDVITDRIPQALCDSAAEVGDGPAVGTVWVPDELGDSARSVLEGVAIKVERVG